MLGGVAVISGASRGIGRACALELARQGWKIGINYLSNHEQAESLAQEIVNTGSEAITLPADVKAAEECRQMIDKVVKHWGSLQVLINNAGIARDQLLLRISDQEWDEMLATNLNSAFYCTRQALRPMMKSRYGRVINMSSVVGIAGNTGQAHYAAAKAGLVGFTRTIAKEYGGKGITANAIAPGYIDTDMTRGMNEAAAASIKEKIAVGRLGNAQDIAALAAFLASPAAAYITGQVIQVDGGLSL
ncbi:MAG: 3-oxoacyl-[acyl-carrier-protein] reductase [Methylocystaceae bacterium]